MFEHRGSPSIDQVLDDFERDGVIARHPATARRFAATRTRLLAYLATDAQRALLPDERVLLTSERQFAPLGAFSRVFGASVLIAALPGFLDAGWLPRQAYDARAQIRFAELLCDWILARRLVDAGEMSCLVYEVRDAARGARAAIPTTSGEPGPTLGPAARPAAHEA